MTSAVEAVSELSSLATRSLLAATPACATALASRTASSGLGAETSTWRISDSGTVVSLVRARRSASVRPVSLAARLNTSEVPISVRAL